jgi:hypothetical protein
MPRSPNFPERCDPTAKNTAFRNVDDDIFSQEHVFAWECRNCPRSFRIPSMRTNQEHSEELLPLFQGSHCRGERLFRCSACDGEGKRRYYRGDVVFFLLILNDHPYYAHPAHRRLVDEQIPRSFIQRVNDFFLRPFEKWLGL